MVGATQRRADPIQALVEFINAEIHESLIINSVNFVGVSLVKFVIVIVDLVHVVILLIVLIDSSFC